MFIPTERNAEFFADINSRITALRTNPQSGQQVIAEIDALECLIYQKINEILRIPDVFNNPAFNDFMGLDKILKQLFELRMMYPFLYFKEIDEWLIPEGYTDTSESFMYKQFQIFTTHCLDLSELPQPQQSQIFVLIAQIMSRPVGQRLIVRLNQMQQASEKIIKIQNYLGRNLLSASLSATPLQPGFFSPYKRFEGNTQYKNVIIRCPQDAYKRGFELNYGKHSNFSYKPVFISLAHELIHTLHFLRGRDRCSMQFDERYGDIINALFKKNVEELWTIDLGKNLSENKIREEWGLDLRYSHITIFQGFIGGDHAYSPHNRMYDFRDAPEIQAEIQHRLAMQACY